MSFHTAHIVNAREITAPEYRVILNGQRVYPDVMPIETNDGLLLPLRCIAETLGAIVTWDDNSKTAFISYKGNLKICKDTLINDTMMASLDFFTEAFNTQTRYNDKLSLIIMNTDGKDMSDEAVLALLPSYNGYSGEDLDWLAKIVEAEAQGETYPSKLGVANVIINRRDSGQYPETIKGVIFDKKYGVQFTPTVNGAVYNTPSASSFIAAMEALEGRNNAPRTLFFMNPVIATSQWIANNRQYAFTIGGHSYYY